MPALSFLRLCSLPSCPLQWFKKTVATVSMLALLSSTMTAQTEQGAQQNSQTALPSAPQAMNPTTGAVGTPLPQQNPQPEYEPPLHESTRPYSILELWKPYMPHLLPEPVLKNSDRLHSLIQNGRLMLSLNDAVALALENNFDIAIARYNLDIAHTDLLLAKAGGTVRGVNTGLVSGTPGGIPAPGAAAGAQGGGAGGTTPGVGGAATAGGIVVSTLATVGPPIDPRDPVITGTLQWDRNLRPIGIPSSTGGATFLDQRTDTYNFGYEQGFPTGTLLTVAFNNQQVSVPANSPIQPFQTNPLFTANWQASLRQHLLQGFGLAVNQRQIYIAKNDIKVTDASFRAQVISTVAQIQNIYWDLVNAYESVKVQETALAFANQTLSNNKLQVQIGTMAPIEVVSAQSSVSTATQNLINAQTNLQYQQLITKNAIARNFNDPELTAAVVIPTDTMALSTEPEPPADELVNYALANRPELLESELNLRNGEINNKAARNALLPTLDAVAYYGSAGLNDNYQDVFTNLVNRDFPDKGAYLSLNIPLRNRRAQANQIRAQLEYRQNELLFQQQKNQINLQVRNAAYALQQARAGVDSARAAHDFALQSLEAEQKKYSLGASTSLLVMQQKSNETQAASNYVSALSTYEKARVALEQATSLILERNGITMEDAVRGQVTHPPAIPGLVPNPTPGTIGAPPPAK
jgi:outer membrane protein